MMTGRATNKFLLRVLPLLMAGLIITGTLSVSGQPFHTKKGGICFRIDNNPSLPKLHQIDSLFSLYNQQFSMAMISWVFPLAPDYIDTLISFSAKGYEVMDNTPTHQTQFFNLINESDTSLFSGHPGVDHFNQTKVCLSYASVDTFQTHNEGLVDVTGNMVVSHDPGEFGDLDGNPYFFALYLNTVNEVYLWYDRSAVDPSDPDTVFIRTLWEESVDLGIMPDLQYHKLTQVNVIMKPEAILLLGERSRALFNQFNIPPPMTWIHPDGQMPMLSGYQVKDNFGDSLGYSAGSNFVNESFLCYNEFNPFGINQYGMQNDEISISQHSFAWNKHRIADYVAKHYVKIDISTLQGTLGGFDNYLLRLDSLLSWCTTNAIPIGTYSQWNTWLYDSIPVRVANIFPKLNVDLDDDLYPDGFEQESWINSEYETTDGVAFSGNCSFVLDTVGHFCEVNQLTGLESGNNYFNIWTKNVGSDSNTTMVHAEFSFPENGTVVAFDIPSDTSIWSSHTEFVYVPDSVTLMNIMITRTDTMPDTLKISGMEFKSAGFLNKSVYPHQTVLQNEQFADINLFNLVIDTIYNPSTITWWVEGNDSMNFVFLSTEYLQPQKPYSFWIGQDTTWLKAQSPDGILDSCLLTFTSLPMEGACPGLPVTITLLDTLDNDFIHWSSTPHDSTISDSTIYNPTVNPQVTTLYKVQVISPLGPIQYDSLLIERFPVPQASLPEDTTICLHDSVTLVASGGTHYFWSTGDTTATITVSPSSTTQYDVFVINQYECSDGDSTVVIVRTPPEVSITGLWPAYCVYDISSTAVGNPVGGIFSGPGLTGNDFYPDSANIGLNTITYLYIDEYGCPNSDTVSVTVYPRPEIRPQPTDTNVCADKSIKLNAGGGNESYLWSNGDTNFITSVDTTGVGLGPYNIHVYVTNNGCVNMDTAYIIFVECPIGIEELQDSHPYMVYPNPAGEYVYITSKKPDMTRFIVEVFTLRGERMIYQPNSVSTTKISLNGLPSGLFLLRVTETKAVYHYRLVRY